MSTGIAIATFGAASGQALADAVGPLIEIPALIGVIEIPVLIGVAGPRRR